MGEELGKKKFGILIAVVVLSSGLIAWALVALFKTEGAFPTGEELASDVYDEETPEDQLPGVPETEEAASTAPATESLETPAAAAPTAPPAPPPRRKRQTGQVPAEPSKPEPAATPQGE